MPDKLSDMFPDTFIPCNPPLLQVDQVWEQQISGKKLILTKNVLSDGGLRPKITEHLIYLPSEQEGISTDDISLRSQYEQTGTSIFQINWIWWLIVK